MSIGTNIATLIAIGVATVSAVIVAFAGFQYATASGDPQKIGIAKSSFVGAFIGLGHCLSGLHRAQNSDRHGDQAGWGRGAGYAGRAELRQRAQEPTGLPTGGLDQADRMQVVISQIQAQQQECAKDVWKPEAIDINVVTAGAIAAGPDGQKGQVLQDWWGAFYGYGCSNLPTIKFGDQDLPKWFAKVCEP